MSARRFLHVLILLSSAPAFAQCTLSRVDLLWPLDGCTVIVGSGFEDIPFVPVALPDCELDTLRVAFHCDGIALGAVTVSPYTLAASRLADFGVGPHSLLAAASPLAAPDLYSPINQFSILQADTASDFDLNGYPDYPFTALPGDGYHWLSEVPVPGVIGHRRVGLLRWRGLEPLPIAPPPLAISLADSLGFGRVVTVLAPRGLLLPGEIGILLVTTADDLDTLLGPDQAALLAARPIGFVFGAQYVHISIIVSTDGGLTFSPIPAPRLVANPLFLCIQGFSIAPPATARFFSHPTAVTVGGAGLSVLAEPGLWSPSNAFDTLRTSTSVSATLTGLSVFGLFTGGAAEGEGEGEGEIEPGPQGPEPWPWLIGGAAAAVGALAIGQSGGDDGGSCFIATAAYGTPMAGSVGVLRRFRDAYLLESAPGTAFVDLYYRFSPPLADEVAARPAVAAAVRVALWPVVWLAGMALAEPAAFSAFLLFCLACGLLKIGGRWAAR